MEIKAHFREGRNKPWEARWWVHRKMRSKFFATEKERDRFVREFSKEIARNGEEVFKFDKDRMRRWQEADHLVPGIDPVTLAEFWLENHRDEPTLTLAEAIKSYLEQMKLAGRDPDYLKHTRKALDRFCAQYGELAVGAIEAADIAEFLHGLPFEPLTRKHYRTYLVSAYKWFIRQGWVNHNPASAVTAPNVRLPWV